VIVYAFWREEIKYSLPTPVPEEYASVNPGEKVNLPPVLRTGTSYFLHFYNAECPCSRFNAKHIRSLIGNYYDSIRFVVVVNDESALTQARKEFGNHPEYLLDAQNEIARACGVYSTPQAAIVTKDGNLFYRGNYNRARYCTTRASNFAELSLIALINQRPPLQLGIEATQAYGCELVQPDIEFF
jgi:hypothetical protein